MSVSVRMAQVAVNTSIGNQDITVAGWGMPLANIKAVMFLMTGATANNAVTQHGQLTIGMADGTRQNTSSMTVKDEATPLTSCARIVFTNECMRGFVPGTGTAGVLDHRAVFVAFIDNGVQINWTDAPASAFLMTAIFFAGTDLLARVDSFQGTGTLSTLAVTVGFQADQIIFPFARASTLAAIWLAADQQFGFADRGPPNQNVSLSYLDAANANSVSPTCYVSNAFAIKRPLGAAVVTINNFTGTTFDAVQSGSTQTHFHPFLALGYQGAVSHGLMMVDSPTGATGVKTVATTFKPQFVMQAVSGVDALNFTANASEGMAAQGAGTFGLVAFSANEMFTNYVTDDDAASPVAPSAVNANSLSDNKLQVLTDGSLPLFAATFDSFNALDYRLNYSLLSATVRKWPTLIIGAETTPPVAGPIPVMQNSYRQRRS